MPLIIASIFFILSRPGILYKTAFNLPRTFCDIELGRALFCSIFFSNISKDLHKGRFLVSNFSISSGILLKCAEIRATYLFIEGSSNASWLELIPMASVLSNVPTTSFTASKFSIKTAFTG